MALFSRLFARPEPVPVVLYTRASCPLCTEMKVEIERAHPARRFTLTEVDVASDRRLEQAYGTRVPVLEIAGEVAFEGRCVAEDFALAIDRARC